MMQSIRRPTIRWKTDFPGVYPGQSGSVLRPVFGPTFLYRQQEKNLGNFLKILQIEPGHLQELGGAAARREIQMKQLVKPTSSQIRVCEKWCTRRRRFGPVDEQPLDAFIEL